MCEEYFQECIILCNLHDSSKITIMKQADGYRAVVGYLYKSIGTMALLMRFIREIYSINILNFKGVSFGSTS